MRGKFITLEGGEGAGKSTLARGLAEHLRGQGLEVVVTREPGGTSNAEAIRELLVGGDVNRWSPIGEALLLYAAREDHVRTLIEPALEAGKWVISDRFADSTLAYQSAAGGLKRETVEALHQLALDGYQPDLTLVVDLDPKVGLERTIARGEGATRFELQSSEFHNALRAEFVAIANREPERCAVLDGSLDADSLRSEALKLVSERLVKAI
ncbi:dTMP kinase [Maricaulaceae bacterium NA33B04]|nr:dTMP kinase [Maricaulaceae bacterium NA33B04]